MQCSQVTFVPLSSLLLYYKVDSLGGRLCETRDYPVKASPLPLPNKMVLESTSNGIGINLGEAKRRAMPL